MVTSPCPRVSRRAHINLLGGRRRKKGANCTRLSTIESSILWSVVRRPPNEMEEVMLRYCCSTALRVIIVVGAHVTDTYIQMVSVLSKPDQICRRHERKPPSSAPTHAANARRGKICSIPHTVNRAPSIRHT